MMNFTDPLKKPALVFSRQRVTGNLEKKELWRAGLRNLDGRMLKPELRRPFMNFKECRDQLFELLGEGIRLPSSQAFKGQRTFYLPTDPVLLRIWSERISVPYDPAVDEDKERRKHERMAAWRSDF
jgi:hypothetical protein